MYTVYDLRGDKDHIKAVQAASLSPKPFGVKTTMGLFGSDAWWRNIATGIIPVVRLTGKITRLFRAGMHNESECFEMTTEDGKTFEYDCKVAHRNDRKHYQIGRSIEFSFVHLELKRPVMTTTGEVHDTHTRCVLNIQISDS